MSITESLKDFLGVGGSTTSIERYRCADCDHTFESAKSPDRCSCPECLSHDVSKVD
ncbi:MAG: hypothetical protein ABEJ23_00335 [Haloarculaceae archaeon]